MHAYFLSEFAEFMAAILGLAGVLFCLEARG